MQVQNKAAISANATQHELVHEAAERQRHEDNAAPMAGDDIPKYLAHNETWLRGMDTLREAGVRLPLPCAKLTSLGVTQPLTASERGCARPPQTTRRAA